MTEQEILEIENQAWAEVPDDLRSGAYNRMLTNFAAIIEDKTLERAAMVCEELHSLTSHRLASADALDCAYKIRALKEKK